ncbi:hypothetical protein SCP_0501410 [Sparassis crispa]|uniref:Uncharacterized protein n=1 Tax=Sparassis crispa TaxID=139825 RepID=A0A401GLP1_9APHY|nr:hypothetical protein SCP_0501410 [Sparassis crispa]GBE83095.1 hypothetical protein SCP_0501410 [Sparassis crispa]
MAKQMIHYFISLRGSGATAEGDRQQSSVLSTLQVRPDESTAPAAHGAHLSLICHALKRSRNAPSSPGAGFIALRGTAFSLAISATFRPLSFHHHHHHPLHTHSPHSHPRRHAVHAVVASSDIASPTG